MKLLYLGIGCIFELIVLVHDIAIGQQPDNMLKALIYSLANILLWPIGVYSLINLLRRR